MTKESIVNWVKQNITPPTAALKATVDAWLDTQDVGLHIVSAITTSARVGSYRSNMGVVNLSDIPALQSVGSGESSVYAFDKLNELYSLTADCNIDGIPIHTQHVDYDRQVDVSEASVISQKRQTRDNVIVNASPHGRVFTVKGYLNPNGLVDNYLLVKPSLYVQLDWLDAMATSRRPVWFKDKANRFFYVQITNLHYEDAPESPYTYFVDITMQEYITIDTNAVSLNKTGIFKGKQRQVGI